MQTDPQPDFYGEWSQLIVALGKVLKDEKWDRHLDGIQSDLTGKVQNDAFEYAVQIFQAALSGDEDRVQARLKYLSEAATSGDENEKKEMENFCAVVKELAPEIELWLHESAVLKSEIEAMQQTKREHLADGGYPKFLHANQVKQYLKSNGIEREIIVRKYNDYYHISKSPHYTAFVKYSREELKAVNPDTPDHGDPFIVSHQNDQLPDFLRVEQLLKDSNVGVLIMGPGIERGNDEAFE